MKQWDMHKRIEKELPSFLKAGLIKFNQNLIRAANYLQAKTNGYSAGKKKKLLGVFIAISFGGSILILVQSITQQSKISLAVARIQTITLPKEHEQTAHISQQELLKIQKFKNYMDSLGASAKGRRVRDSLLHQRPHLMDSVHFLINLYFKLSKTKQ